MEAVSNYSRIHFTNGKKLLVAKVLQKYQDLLPQKIFVRVHRSHLINRNFIKEVYGAVAKTVLLNNGENISVSRRKKEMVVNILKQYS